MSDSVGGVAGWELTTAEMWQRVSDEYDAAVDALGRQKALLDVLGTRMVMGLPLAEQDTVAGRAIAKLQSNDNAAGREPSALELIAPLLPYLRHDLRREGPACDPDGDCACGLQSAHDTYKANFAALRAAAAGPTEAEHVTAEELTPEVLAGQLNALAERYWNKGRFALSVTLKDAASALRAAHG